jgi:ubiquitin carboxyl-terminal hydrolase 22/27/51
MTMILRSFELFPWVFLRKVVLLLSIFRFRLTQITAPKKRAFSESSSDEAYIKSNATKRPCAKEGVRGLFNLGQTCYLNVVLQTLLHDPLLNTYFLGNGHLMHNCLVKECILCATAEAFTDFNNSDKTEGFAALNLLLATWRSSSVSHTIGELGLM